MKGLLRNAGVLLLVAAALVNSNVNADCVAHVRLRGSNEEQCVDNKVFQQMSVVRDKYYSRERQGLDPHQPIHLAVDAQDYLDLVNFLEIDTPRERENHLRGLNRHRLERLRKTATALGALTSDSDRLITNAMHHAKK